MPRFSLIPRDTRFFEVFEKIAQNLLECATEFHKLLQNYENAASKVEAIKDFEHRGDSMTHEVIEVLNRTFVTPLDREDIYKLAESLDNVVDQIDEAASRLIIFDIAKPTPYAVELADLIRRCCEQIHKAMPYLRHPKELPALQDNLLQIHTLENRADAIKKDALTQLFKNPDNVIDLLKWREIYEHLEAATDRCEDVADVLQGLLVKNA
jgi:predicted phosphate transport protein (TIGR00153 family)